MPKVTILPSGDSIEVEENKSLLEALKENDIYIKSSCGGVASCSDCVIKVASGIDNLTPPPFDEIKLLGNVFHITKERLSCQAKCTGDVTIDISAHNKATDEEKLRAKTSDFLKQKKVTKTRKKDEVQTMYKERQEGREEKEKKNESWNKHWEKEQDPMKPKRLGGGKRPKPFRTDHLDEQEAETPPEVSIDSENTEE